MGSGLASKQDDHDLGNAAIAGSHALDVSEPIGKCPVRGTGKPVDKIDRASKTAAPIRSATKISTTGADAAPPIA